MGEVLAIVAAHLEKPQGDKGDKGDTGYSPEKGKDYYTEEEQRVLVEKIYGLIHTPKKGEDYYTEAEKKEIIDIALKAVLEGVQEARKDIKNPQRGVDFMHDADWENIREDIQRMVTEGLKDFDAKALTQVILGVGLKTITVSPTQPKNPKEGDLWVDTALR